MKQSIHQKFNSQDDIVNFLAGYFKDGRLAMVYSTLGLNDENDFHSDDREYETIEQNMALIYLENYFNYHPDSGYSISEELSFLCGYYKGLNQLDYLSTTIH